MALWEIIAFCVFLAVMLACFVVLTIEEVKRYKAFTQKELSQAQLNQKILQILEAEWSDLNVDQEASGDE